MGYMGFGMRKEVYSRKPKSAFRNIKASYAKELRKGGTNYTYKNCDASTLESIRQKIKNQRIRAFYVKIFTGIIFVIGIWFGLWMFVGLKTSYRTSAKSQRKSYFVTKIYKLGHHKELKVDYYKLGPKSAETHYKNGMRHQNSESYYESGEQFRSAAYFKDTLVVEVYFFKNGDTIKNFPKITDQNVHHLLFRIPNSNKTAEFDFLDGKILSGSYTEHISTN